MTIRSMSLPQDAVDAALRELVGPTLAKTDADNAWRRYQVPYPDARAGDFALERFHIPQGDPDRLHRVFREGPDRDTGWGDFVRLVEHPDGAGYGGYEGWCESCSDHTRHWREDDGTEHCEGCDAPPEGARLLWMGDTRAEILEHAPLFDRVAVLSGAPGSRRVLINGLGLGVAVHGVLTHEVIGHVDVVELNREVAMLVGQFLDPGRVTVHVADAYKITWPADARWDVAWHDIWPMISDENLPGMRSLHRKYRRTAGWQGSWQRAGCELMAKRMRRAQAGHIHGTEAEMILDGKWAAHFAGQPAGPAAREFKRWRDERDELFARLMAEAERDRDE